MNPPRFSSDSIHKLEVEDQKGRIVRFGRAGYGDFLIYQFLESQGKEPEGKAEMKRNVFHKSHEAIKGNWKSNPYSPNNLSLKLLW